MPTITLEGRPAMKTAGELPKVGSIAPDFVLTDSNMAQVSLANFKGRKVIMNIFPSVDTRTSKNSIKKFDKISNSIRDTVVLNISVDTPFAHQRVCARKETFNVIALSATTRPEFGKTYGVRIEDGYLEGYFARAVVVLNEEGVVIHNELVGELTEEPDYQTCIDAVKPKEAVLSPISLSETEKKEKSDGTMLKHFTMKFEESFLKVSSPKTLSLVTPSIDKEKETIKKIFIDELIEKLQKAMNSDPLFLSLDEKKKESMSNKIADSIFQEVIINMNTVKDESLIVEKCELLIKIAFSISKVEEDIPCAQGRGMKEAVQTLANICFSHVDGLPSEKNVEHLTLAEERIVKALDTKYSKI